MSSVCVWTCPAQRLMFWVQQEDCSTRSLDGETAVFIDRFFFSVRTTSSERVFVWWAYSYMECGNKNRVTVELFCDFLSCSDGDSEGDGDKRCRDGDSFRCDGVTDLFFFVWTGWICITVGGTIATPQPSSLLSSLYPRSVQDVLLHQLSLKAHDYLQQRKRSTPRVCTFYGALVATAACVCVCVCVTAPYKLSFYYWTSLFHQTW